MQPSRRPSDGRYGDNPNRLQHYYQFQVLIKPSPPDLQELYLGSLAAIGVDAALHDIRFVEDDWESPTLGAWGLGWEVWCDGMEVSQFTYFQQVGGHDCRPVSGELTYGLERLAMYVLGVDHVMDMPFNDPDAPIPLSYGDVFRRTEREYSRWNFEVADTDLLLRHFEDAEAECARILARAPARPRRADHRHGAPRLRPVHQGEPPVQPARRPRRDLGHRAPGLHRPGARAGQGLRRRLRRRRGRARVSGKILMIGLLAFAALFGAALVWFQFFAFYERASGVGALTVAGVATPIADYDGIDAATSPLKLRGCFRADPASFAAAEPAPDATPLTAPFWFRCFDAGALTADLAAGRATAYALDARRPGRLRPAWSALYPDGRGYLWRQLGAAVPGPAT